MVRKLWLLVVAGALSAAACSQAPPPQAPTPTPVPRPTPERLALDAEASPVAFRWLGDDAVLVAPKAGKRTLASFGNYIDRSARNVQRARLSVWDDEDAWRQSLEADDTPSDSTLAHKRAQFLKNAGDTPVEQFTVFDREGKVVYERNFRDWPLTEADEP